jgi:hypothetical protein
MVSKCANPVCSIPFRYLHEGKLFRIARSFPSNADGKRSATHIEFFWLCKDCSRNMTLNLGENGEITTLPLFRVFQAAS